MNPAPRDTLFSTMDRELLKGSTPLLLLSLLLDGPMYGYQIIATVKERTQGFYTLKEGALYPALHKLEASGYIQSYWQTQSSGRDRRYYAMLPAGEAYLDDKRVEWARFVSMVEAFLIPAPTKPTGGHRLGTSLEFPEIQE